MVQTVLQEEFTYILEAEGAQATAFVPSGSQYLEGGLALSLA